LVDFEFTFMQTLTTPFFDIGIDITCLIELQKSNPHPQIPHTPQLPLRAAAAATH
jgi:hypothetical protein